MPEALVVLACPYRQLLVELFIEDALGNTLPPGSDTQGVYLMASRQTRITDTYDNGPPTVSRSAACCKVRGGVRQAVPEEGQAAHCTQVRIL